MENAPEIVEFIEPYIFTAGTDNIDNVVNIKVFSYIWFVHLIRSTMDLPPPKNVSPLIRAARWGLLIAGIFYGWSKHTFLAAREVGIREEEHRKKVIRDAVLAEEKRIASEKDVEMLGRMLVPESYEPIPIASSPSPGYDDDDDDDDELPLKPGKPKRSTRSTGTEPRDDCK